MPVDAQGQYYEPSEVMPRFGLTPRVVASSSNGSAVDVGAVEELDVVLGSHEFYTTALSGTNNDIVWVARTPGTSALTVTYVVSGNDTELSVTKTTNDITVNVATNSGGTATSTANDIIDFVNTDESASEIEQAVHLLLAAGNDGTGVVTSLSQQSLGGPSGTSPTLDVTLESSIDAGATWQGVASFTQLDGTAVAHRKVFVGLGDKVRWAWTIGGTSTPTFVISVVSRAKE